MGSKTLMYQLGLKLDTYQKSILGKMAVQCPRGFSNECIRWNTWNRVKVNNEGPSR